MYVQYSISKSVDNKRENNINGRSVGQKHLFYLSINTNMMFDGCMCARTDDVKSLLLCVAARRLLWSAAKEGQAQEAGERRRSDCCGSAGNGALAGCAASRRVK